MTVNANSDGILGCDADPVSEEQLDVRKALHHGTSDVPIDAMEKLPSDNAIGRKKLESYRKNFLCPLPSKTSARME